ncbi:MAG: hypothetical protein SVR08_01815 [Spirochaetota bacterium]|nr:hypothetical protein [Spirochaetota bacterium]
MKIILFIIIASILMVSCNTIGIQSIYKSKITVLEAVKQKELIDQSDNPAFKHMILKELKDTLIKIDDVTIKEIKESGNIDYNFCIVISVPYTKGEVECYIYAKDNYLNEDIETLSKLTKGKSRIDVIGEFVRFFSLLDETYTKMEIENAKITIREDK